MEIQNLRKVRMQIVKSFLSLLVLCNIICLKAQKLSGDFSQELTKPTERIKFRFSDFRFEIERSSALLHDREIWQGYYIISSDTLYLFDGYQNDQVARIDIIHQDTLLNPNEIEIEIQLTDSTESTECFCHVSGLWYDEKILDFQNRDCLIRLSLEAKIINQLLISSVGYQNTSISLKDLWGKKNILRVLLRYPTDIKYRSLKSTEKMYLKSLRKDRIELISETNELIVLIRD